MVSYQGVLSSRSCQYVEWKVLGSLCPAEVVNVDGLNLTFAFSICPFAFVIPPIPPISLLHFMSPSLLQMSKILWFKHSTARQHRLQDKDFKITALSFPHLELFSGLYLIRIFFHVVSYFPLFVIK